jgi:hypothetical protein
MKMTIELDARERVDLERMLAAWRVMWAASDHLVEEAETADGGVSIVIRDRATQPIDVKDP